MRIIELKIILNLAAVIALSAQTDEPRQPLARIGDEPIYEEDLLPSIASQLFRLKDYEYDLRMTALQNLVNQRLLREEAKGSGLSIQQFLAEKVDRNVPRPTAREIEAYHLAHKDPVGRSFDEIKSQLEQTVTQSKIQKARHDYLDNLQHKAGVAILYRRPKLEIRPDPSRTRGALDSPVTIVEFADFQCPSCQEAEETLRNVLDKYSGRVSLAFRDFPLKQIHPLAQQAAEASRCAGEQGKFWKYHDLLLVSGARLDWDGLREHARKSELDVERFGTCMEKRKFAPLVEDDLVAGYKSGVSSTPTFYVNGIPLVGVQPVSAFETLIDSELAAAGIASAVTTNLKK